MKTIFQNNRFSTAVAALAGFAVIGFSACKKKDPPAPAEEELITTIRLTLTGGGSSTPRTFIYKVQNGFNQSSPGVVQADTLRLTAGTSYQSRLEVLNESVSPAEDVTSEIEEEKDEHLFLFVSDPASGAGSVSFSSGSLDNNALPFNLTGTVTAGSAGAGRLTIYLKHQPTDKTATTSAAAGPGTDAEAIFPVLVQ